MNILEQQINNDCYDKLEEEKEEVLCMYNNNITSLTYYYYYNNDLFFVDSSSNFKNNYRIMILEIIEEKIQINLISINVSCVLAMQCYYQTNKQEIKNEKQIMFPINN